MGAPHLNDTAAATWGQGGVEGGGQQCAFDAMMEVAIYLFVGSRLPARRPPDIMIAPSITIH